MKTILIEYIKEILKYTKKTSKKTTCKILKIK